MKYNKLVRDKIPEIYENEGKIVEIASLDGEDFAKALIEKFDEQSISFKECFLAEDDENAVKKIAELTEILNAILNLIGVERSSFEKICNAEKTKFGGYEKYILLKEVSD